MRLAMSVTDGRGGRSGRGRPGPRWDLLEYLDDFGSRSRLGKEEARTRKPRWPTGPRRRTPASVAILRALLVLDILASLLAVLYAVLTG